MMIHSIKVKMKGQSIQLLGVLLMMLAVGLQSCSKKDNQPDPRKNYPKDVEIEYKVTGLSANMNKLDIRYDNETGASTALKDQALPFTKKIRRKVDYAETISLSISSMLPGSAKLEILVNNQLVETKSPVSEQYLSGSLVYSFH